MKILIADSGSTKTDWRFIDHEQKILAFRSEGLNPYMMSGEEMEKNLRGVVMTHTGNHMPDQLFFYGAGTGAEEKRMIVKNALAGAFPGAQIDVETDLLGAARALCGKEKGMAAILGTGSNSCSYDGEMITENRPSLGFILGDEGSGACLGKELIRLFLYEEMEPQLKENFSNRFQLTRAEILDHVYRQPNPNRYLASFAKFIFQNIDKQQCVDLVANNFRAFFQKHILRYSHAKELPLHVTGSVGFYFSNILRRVSEEQGVRLGRVTETPIAGLVNFHLGEK